MQCSTVHVQCNPPVTPGMAGKDTFPIVGHLKYNNSSAALAKIVNISTYTLHYHWRGLHHESRGWPTSLLIISQQYSLQQLLHGFNNQPHWQAGADWGSVARVTRTVTWEQMTQGQPGLSGDRTDILLLACMGPPAPRTAKGRAIPKEKRRPLNTLVPAKHPSPSETP